MTSSYILLWKPQGKRETTLYTSHRCQSPAISFFPVFIFLPIIARRLDIFDRYQFQNNMIFVY
jgi:hypothetical protein